MHPCIHLVCSVCVSAIYVWGTGDASLPTLLAVPLGVLIDMDHVLHALYYLPDKTMRELKRLSVRGLYKVMTDDMLELWDASTIHSRYTTYLVTHGTFVALAITTLYILFHSPVLSLTLTLHFLLDFVWAYTWHSRYF